MKIKESSGKIKKYLIEIKPQRQTVPPVAGKKKRKTLITEALTYEKNKANTIGNGEGTPAAKWKAAEEWCLDRGLEFRIITEKELGIKDGD